MKKEVIKVLTMDGGYIQIETKGADRHAERTDNEKEPCERIGFDRLRDIARRAVVPTPDETEHLNLCPQCWDVVIEVRRSVSLLGI